jgi:hypothetical protein
MNTLFSKNLFCTIILLACLAGCKKDNTEQNIFIGTKWTATDDIAELIYGKTCTTSIEFLTEITCQEIEIRRGMTFGSGTFITQGTYTANGNSVSWVIGTITINGIASGSVLKTDMGTIAGGKRVYTKD